MAATSNHSHYEELLRGQYPVPERINLTSRFVPASVPTSVTLPFEYKCCTESFTSIDSSIEHWLNWHFPRDGVYPPNPCRSPSDISNPEIPIEARAEFFMESITCFPGAPLKFRPRPLGTPPRAFEDPLQGAMAMAYDFMEVVRTKPDAYRILVNSFEKDADFDWSVPAQLHLFVLWADYQGRHAATNPARQPTVKDKSGVRFYACPVNECTRKYKHQSSLYNHRVKGKCPFTEA